MARRIVTAREQHEMLSPWRLASTVDGDYADQPRDENGRVLLWRGVGQDGAHMTYVNQPDPETPGLPFHFRPPQSWDEVEDNHDAENWNNYGNWWGGESEAKGYGGDNKIRNDKYAPHGAMAVQAWFPREHVHDTEDGDGGVWVQSGAQGEVAQAHVYHRGKGWVPLHDAGGRTVTAMAYWLHHGGDTVHHLPVNEALSYRQYDPMDPHQDFFAYDKGYPVLDKPGMHESGWAMDAHGRPKIGDDMYSADDLRNSLRQSDIHSPVEIITDGQRAFMTDGTHRSTIAAEVGHSHIPAYINKLTPENYNAIARESPLSSLPRPHPSVGPTVQSILAPASRTAAIPAGWERYVDNLSGRTDRSGEAHLHLPVDVLDHYKEHDRDLDDPQTQALAHVIATEGVRSPVQISTDGTHALMHEGNHRLAIAKQLGITHLPVKVTMEPPGEVITNEDYSRPVPLEHQLGSWVADNKHRLKSFWKGG